jgi:hypothetical protein
VKEAKPIYVTQSSKVEELHVENLKWWRQVFYSKQEVEENAD